MYVMHAADALFPLLPCVCSASPPALPCPACLPELFTFKQSRRHVSFFLSLSSGISSGHGKRAQESGGEGEIIKNARRKREKEGERQKSGEEMRGMKKRKEGGELENLRGNRSDFNARRLSILEPHPFPRYLTFIFFRIYVFWGLSSVPLKSECLLKRLNYINQLLEKNKSLDFI